MHRLLWGKMSQMLVVFFFPHICRYDLTIPPQADVQFLMSWCEAYSLLWFCKNLVGKLFPPPPQPTLESTVNLEILI